MAVVFVEGFDSYKDGGNGPGLVGRWIDDSSLSSAPTLTTGRFGGQAVSLSTSSYYTRLAIGVPAVSSFALGMAFYATYLNGSASARIIDMKSNTTYTFGVVVTSAGSIRVYRSTSSSAATLLGETAAGVILLNTWHYLEFEVVISDTVGVVNVYVDGTQKLALTNQDTNNGVTTVDMLCLGSEGTPGCNAYYDDIYLTDSATRLGGRRVITLIPTSDVAQGFTRSAGSDNYALVDETASDGDTTYVEAGNVSTVDTYNLQDLTGTPDAISAVQLVAHARKTGGADRSIALQVVSGVTTSDGSALPLAASYTHVSRLLTTDPDTASAWSASGVNALKAGPKVVV